MTYDYYEISEGIFCHPEVMGGRPTVGRTRITAGFLARYLISQTPPSSILEDYPFLTAEDINNAKRFLEKALIKDLKYPLASSLTSQDRTELLAYLRQEKAYPNRELLELLEEAKGDEIKLKGLEKHPAVELLNRFVEVFESPWIFVIA